jgi:ribosomal protein S18 acetylase RimI-like enzyme
LRVNRIHELPGRKWRIRLEVDEAESKVAAAVAEDGTLIGLAAAGATRDGDAPTDWELYSINVLAEVAGTGVADELLWTTVGNTDTTVWVLAENARAQGFYRRCGFRVEGAARAHEGTGAAEIRMVRLSAVSER